MQTVYDQRLFSLPSMPAMPAKQPESRAEALRMHNTMDPAEAHLGWRVFGLGLVCSSLLLASAYVFNL